MNRRRTFESRLRATESKVERLSDITKSSANLRARSLGKVFVTKVLLEKPEPKVWLSPSAFLCARVCVRMCHRSVQKFALYEPVCIEQSLRQKQKLEIQLDFELFSQRVAGESLATQRGACPKAA